MTLVLCLCPTALAQTTNDIRPLELGQPVEREITGGTTNTCQIQLAVGQIPPLPIGAAGLGCVYHAGRVAIGIVL